MYPDLPLKTPPGRANLTEAKFEDGAKETMSLVTNKVIVDNGTAKTEALGLNGIEHPSPENA